MGGGKMLGGPFVWRIEELLPPLFFCNPRPPTKEKIERSGGEGRWDLEVFGAEGEEREEEVGWWRSELSSQSGRV
jgi:hypothetical protein